MHTVNHSRGAGDEQDRDWDRPDPVTRWRRTTSTHPNKHPVWLPQRKHKSKAAVQKTLSCGGLPPQETAALHAPARFCASCTLNAILCTAQKVNEGFQEV